MNNIFQTLLYQREKQKDTVLATIVWDDGSAPRGAGSQMLVGAEGLLSGTIGGGAVELRSIQLARALLAPGELLILDEPTAGLDPKGRDEILQQIKKLQTETGLTILLVSHSMEDVAEYVDRIIVMNKGSVMYDDTPREVFKHYKELEEVGLAAPQVTYIMHELKARGADVDVDATTIEEAAEEIARVWKQNNQK